MKSLEDFKSAAITEAEEKDRRNFDMLVRAGLANKAQLQRIHKILDKMGEERPQFNNADKMILQNLFNKMVDLISNNKQISQKVRTAVREEVEDLEEGVLDTSDYKIGADGRKVKAHRLKVGSTEAELKVEDTIQAEDDTEQLDEKYGKPVDPPAVLVLKRKAIRVFPNNTRIALYYNDKLKKIFSVPYATPPDFSTPMQSQDAVVVGESIVQEAVLDQLHKIVKNKQAATVKFGNGQTRRVDGYTASAITQVHGALNDENKKKIADMVHKSPEHFHKVATFAFSKTK